MVQPGCRTQFWGLAILSIRGGHWPPPSWCQWSPGCQRVPLAELECTVVLQSLSALANSLSSWKESAMQQGSQIEAVERPWEKEPSFSDICRFSSLHSPVEPGLLTLFHRSGNTGQETNLKARKTMILISVSSHSPWLFAAPNTSPYLLQDIAWVITWVSDSEKWEDSFMPLLNSIGRFQWDHRWKRILQFSWWLTLCFMGLQGVLMTPQSENVTFSGLPQCLQFYH